MVDELGTPLTPRHRRPAAKPAGGRPRIAPWLGLAVVVLAGAGLAGWAYLGRAPQTSHPVQTAAATPGSTLVTPAPAGGGIIEIGPEFPIAAAGGNAAPPEADPSVSEGFDALPDLLEETAYGPVPRIGPAGETPFATYARASLRPEPGGPPLVAIVVTGLGLNGPRTLEAISRLPDNVTLAFAPYGDDLERLTGAARAQGHELMLQVPLEPFDYPANNPGPDTLLTSQSEQANRQNLLRLMARFGSYIGVVNHLGARFTASTDDFRPVLAELGARGLGYLDDGSSNRSLARQLASGGSVPFGRADLQLDLDPSPPAILAALERLAAIARDRGSAIGIASALPVSIEAIAEWAQGLDNGALSLVPASALMEKP